MSQPALPPPAATLRPVRASYHTHVAGHGLPAMLAAAAEAGLDVVGISEHLFQFVEGRPLQRAAPLDGPLGELEEYVAQVRFTTLPGLRVCLGLEVDHLPASAREVRALCAPHPWDYLLGAVHDVDGRPLQAQRPGDLGEAWRVWRRYSLLLEEATCGGLCDILAHPLRLARFLPPPPYLQDLVGPALQAAAAHGVAVELNGADLADRPDLQAELLRWCRDAGCAVSLGADAHRPADVAQNLAPAVGMLRGAGYSAATGFRGRRPVQEPLGAGPHPAGA